MTATTTVTGSATEDLTEDPAQGIIKALDPLFAQIYVDAPDRERTSRSPEPDVRALAVAGLGRLRVPVEFGGGGGSVSTLSEQLIGLAAADSNFVQIFRGHLGFIEFLIGRQSSPVRDGFLRAAGRGELFGPAASVSSAGTADGTAPTTIIDSSTRLDRESDRVFLSGTKFYTTGSLYSDWINVLVVGEDGISEVVVGRNDPGVTVVDDWNGFGQRLTASGTTHFDRVEVRDGHVFDRSSADVAEYLNSFYQLVHSSTQAGILRRAVDDLGQIVRARRRTYPLATSDSARHDPQVLQTVGEVGTAAFAARTAVESTAQAFDTYNSVRTDDSLQAVILGSAATQVLNTRLAGEATWRLFDAASASATDVDLALDRHWRNARTISSHNPAIYKARSIGEYVVNGEIPSSLGNITSRS
ncbi:acyl-CoA dehydrogenase family protein [Gordonia sp. NPDC003376]